MTSKFWSLTILFHVYSRTFVNKQQCNSTLSVIKSFDCWHFPSNRDSVFYILIQKLTKYFWRAHLWTKEQLHVLAWRMFERCEIWFVPVLKSTYKAFLDHISAKSYWTVYKYEIYKILCHMCIFLPLLAFVLICLVIINKWH